MFHILLCIPDEMHPYCMFPFIHSFFLSECSTDSDNGFWTFLHYVFTKPIRHGLDAQQSQFFNKIKLV